MPLRRESTASEGSFDERPRLFVLATETEAASTDGADSPTRGDPETLEGSGVVGVSTRAETGLMGEPFIGATF
jgi:hypothetical protein